MKLVYLNFKQALRHLMRNIGFVLFSVFGLVAGVVCFTMSFNRLWNKVHFESFRPDYRNLYVAYHDWEDVRHNFYNPRPLYLAARSQLPASVDVGLIIEYCDNINSVTQADGKPLTGFSGNMGVLSGNIPELMGMNFIQGRPATSLQRMDQVIVSRDEALRVFGTEKALGKKIRMEKSNGEVLFCTVSGVFDDPHVNTLLWNRWYVSDRWLKESDWTAWNNNNSHVVFRTDAPDVLNRSLAQVKEPCDNPRVFRTEPLRLYGVIHANRTIWECIRTEVLECLVSLLLLVSALFNYAAMLASMFARRLREYQLRISMGARLRNNAAWIYTEVLLVIGMVVLSSFFVLEQTVRWFDMDVDRSILNMNALRCMTGVAAVLSLMSFYPLFHLHGESRRRFAGYMQVSRSYQASLFVQLLVCAFFLMVNATMVRQVRYMLSTECMGFDNRGIVRLWTRDFDNATLEALMNRLNNRECAAIEKYALSPSAVFQSRQCHADSVRIGTDGSAKVRLQYIYMRPEVLDLWGIRPEKGTMMRPDSAQDVRPVMLNRDAAALLGCDGPDAVLPRGLKMDRADRRDLAVSGICHFQPRVMRVEQMGQNVWNAFPLMMLCLGDNEPCYDHEVVYIRTDPERSAEVIAYLKKLLTELDVPEDKQEVERESSYLDEQYEGERRQLRVYSFYMFISLLIAVFGVFSMVGYTMQRQRRAIAIRRVFGARTSDLLRLYLRRYIVVTLLAVCAAYPLARYFLMQVLADYKEVVPYGAGLFVAVALFVGVLVTAIVWAQVFRTMRENPADVVKSE